LTEVSVLAPRPIVNSFDNEERVILFIIPFFVCLLKEFVWYGCTLLFSTKHVWGGWMNIEGEDGGLFIIICVTKNPIKK
jgi:hypothetical protein